MSMRDSAPSPQGRRNAFVTNPGEAYREFRKDGWPLCPGCGDDELWSNAVPASIETIVGCLNCGWKPGRCESAAADPQAKAASIAAGRRRA
jgi:predicted RNA-binding Zn-ribbon protein involved in translation (DUF1610 family)